MLTWSLIVVVVLAGSAGDILLSRGMKEVGEVTSFHPRELFNVVRRGATNFALYLGVGGMAVAFFALLTVLSWAPLSLVEPATGLGYVLNTFGAKFYLKERIDRTRWLGTILVCAGAILLALTER